MPPLAGRPPYATDEPDSVFGTSPQQPQRRVRQAPPDDPNKRTSAYDVYDDYTKDGVALGTTTTSANNPRTSGIGNLLLNMEDDSDDDSEDEVERRPRIPPGINKSAAVPSSPSPANKTAALAAAIGATTPVSAPPRSASHQVPIAARPQPQPQQQQQWPRPAGPPSPPRQQVIAAPRPGYALAAPIAALNASSISPPLKSPGGPGTAPQNPFLPAAPHQPNHHGSPVAPPFVRPIPGSPAPSSRSLAAPHPLQPPITPITPAFIRPSSASPSPTARSFSSSTLGSQGNGASDPCVKFSLDQKPQPIIRGNTEETLLPSRGEKGDDFWRRFSIVAKEPTCVSESSWLKKTRSGTNRLSRYIWIVGVILILAIVGGIGVGVWISRNSPGHQQPKAIGGSDDHFASGTTTTSTSTTSSQSPIGAGGATSTIKHVRPTNTVARREPEPIPLANMVAKHVNRKKRHQVW
jgi:hypothetical protein